MYDYHARYYDPTTARFLSADTLIPDPANPQSLNRYSYVLNSPPNFNDPTGHSCANPSGTSSDPNAPPEVVTCQQTEQKILKSTVRLVLKGWYLDKGYNYHTVIDIAHATVKDDQYLVTHNHFSMVASNALVFGITGIEIYSSATNERILQSNAPFKIANFDDASETLIFDFRFGLFDQLKIPSADFKASNEVDLKVGQEIAQVDWDGNSARVDWSFIQEVGTSTIKHSSGTFAGASGGGVFLNGYHIANNWSATSTITNGNVVGNLGSTAALNSMQVAYYK